jgi:hypothetical protein
MHPDLPSDAEVEGWLKTLGVETLCQWDVLVFLYRHQTALIGSDHLARLSGYATERVVAALDDLETLELVERSRVSQGARLYRFTEPHVPPRGEALRQLLALAEHRGGRLFLSRRLPRGDQSPPAGRSSTLRILEATEQFPRAARRRGRELGEGRKTWRKAI